MSAAHIQYPIQPVQNLNKFCKEKSGSSYTSRNCVLPYWNGLSRKYIPTVVSEVLGKHFAGRFIDMFT